MEKILLVNKAKSRWSVEVEIIKRKDEFGGVDIKITDRSEAPVHIITLEAHHQEAKELLIKLLDVLLEG